MTIPPEWNAKVGATPAVDIGDLPSMQLDAGVESIHGGDDRKQVLDTSTFPASAVAQLILTAHDGHTQGSATGTFITDRVILTAAHAIFVPGGGPTGGMIQSMLVVPGRNGSNTPFGAAKTTNFYVPDMWLQHQLSDFDYALAFVPPAPQVGRFRPVVAPDDELGNLSVRIAGYPIDKEVGTQWFDARVIAGFSAGQVAYDIDTMRGQSGAAVAHLQDGQAFIVAIHRFESNKANFGTRITQSIFDDIRARV